MKTVMVVDDHHDTNSVLCKVLRKSGYRTLSAYSGEEAVAMLATSVPDLVILDVMMPGMNGCEVLRIIRGAQATASLPVIMHTAVADAQARQQAMDIGANGYLVKSGFDLQTFQATVARHL